MIKIERDREIRDRLGKKIVSREEWERDWWKQVPFSAIFNMHNLNLQPVLLFILYYTNSEITEPPLPNYYIAYYN